jgi:hypothetical protein
MINGLPERKLTLGDGPPMLKRRVAAEAERDRTVVDLLDPQVFSPDQSGSMPGAPLTWIPA